MRLRCGRLAGVDAFHVYMEIKEKRREEGAGLASPHREQGRNGGESSGTIAVAVAIAIGKANQDGRKVKEGAGRGETRRDAHQRTKRDGNLAPAAAQVGSEACGAAVGWPTDPTQINLIMPEVDGGWVIRLVEPWLKTMRTSVISSRYCFARRDEIQKEARDEGDWLFFSVEQDYSKFTAETVRRLGGEGAGGRGGQRR